MTANKTRIANKRLTWPSISSMPKSKTGYCPSLTAPGGSIKPRS